LAWYKARILTCIIYIKKGKRNSGYYIIDKRKEKKKEIINIIKGMNGIGI
jgi:hypothetical protein